VQKTLKTVFFIKALQHFLSQENSGRDKRAPWKLIHRKLEHLSLSIKGERKSFNRCALKLYLVDWQKAIHKKLLIFSFSSLQLCQKKKVFFWVFFSKFKKELSFYVYVFLSWFICGFIICKQINVNQFLCEKEKVVVFAWRCTKNRPEEKLLFSPLCWKEKLKNEILVVFLYIDITFIMTKLWQKDLHVIKRNLFLSNKNYLHICINFKQKVNLFWVIVIYFSFF